jgi:hypothetical protein
MSGKGRKKREKPKPTWKDGLEDSMVKRAVTEENNRL